MAKQIPIDTDITLDQLTRNPIPTYRRLHAEEPVLQVQVLDCILLIRAADTKYVKETCERYVNCDHYRFRG